ncbi:MAG TPA: chemotaxis protein CheW [Candidatus Obscuribacterales bacterium]
MVESPYDENAKQAEPGGLSDKSQQFMATLKKAVVQSKSEKLKSRRRSLAAQRRTTVDEEVIEIVEFLLGEDAFAFELEQLTEVCPLVGVTWIPGSPPFVLGVINLRGQIVPIIDLKTFLGIQAGAVTVFNKALIFQQGQLIVGFLADEVIGAKKLPLSSMQFSVGMLCGATADYVRAVTNDRLVILSADKVLTDSRLNKKAAGNS